jgi:Transcription-repair coupling factor (superfamily II helicase)
MTNEKDGAQPSGDAAQAEGGEQIKFAITIASLEQGFALTSPAITVLTERELYGERVAASATASAVAAPRATRKRSSAISPSSPSVRRSCMSITAWAATRACLDGRGRHGWRVPHHRIRQGRQAVRAGGAARPGQPLLRHRAGTAPLHSLGGDAWERARRKAAEKVRDVAAELLAIYAQRQARGGESMPIDRQLVEEFGSTFPFEETPDRKPRSKPCSRPGRAARDGPGDLRRCRLRQDRGRAARRVRHRHRGKQVAVLVPTTLLAQQHYAISPIASPTGRCASTCCRASSRPRK